MSGTVKTASPIIVAIAICAMIYQYPASSVAAYESAETTFKSKCAACHGLDGGGNTPMGKSLKLRDLKSPDVQKQTDAQMLAIISKGKGKMPGYEKSLGGDTCKALVAHLRELAKKK